MWRVDETDWVRLNDERFDSCVSKNQLQVAILDGQLVGCINMTQVDPHTQAMSMLAVEQEHRSRGVGRFLLDSALAAAKEKGCTAVQVELLSPKDGQDPHKNFIRSWYVRKRFEFVKIIDFAEYFPESVKDLAIETVFELFEKQL